MGVCIQSLMEALAEETGLVMRTQTQMLYGTKNGYAVCLGPVTSTSEFISFGVSVSRNGDLPDRELLRQFAEQVEQLLSCEVRQNRANITIRGRVEWKNEKETINRVLEEITAFLQKRGYQS